MTLILKKFGIVLTAIALIAGFLFLPASVLAAPGDFCGYDAMGYIITSCPSDSGSSGGNGSTGDTGGTVAGDLTLGVNSAVCAFNQEATTTTGITDGALIRAQGDIDVYIVKYVCNKKFKRLVLSPHVFESYGHFNWKDVITVDNATLDSFTTSTFVRATSAGDPKVYMLFPDGDTGEKRWITSEAVFLNNDWDWDAIYTINTTDRDAYISGSNITS